MAELILFIVAEAEKQHEFHIAEAPGFSNSEHLRTADRADTPGGIFTVFHNSGFGILTSRVGRDMISRWLFLW